MISLILLRENPSYVRNTIHKKDPQFAIDQLIALDQSVREAKSIAESLRHEKNVLTEAAQQGITTEIREKSIAISKELKNIEAQLKEREAAFQELYLRCPNLLDDDIPEGNKAQNQVKKTWGKKPELMGNIKNHVEIGHTLSWLNFEAAAAMTGSNFALYQHEAVQLMYALTQFMLSINQKHGYSPILPPYLVTAQSLQNASNFPRFKEQVYEVSADQLYLTPTAEVNLTNLFRDRIFDLEELPLRLTAWTSCFRREAGTYGALERGLIRIHQFEKVELYAVCAPEHSATEQERMIACAEEILQKLDIHYRISLLAAQDCSFASAKTYDIEVWMPGQNAYYEVSSISKCTDFQARRTGIRYRAHQGEKPKLAHTLNGSSLALARLMVALMETYQQPDGSLIIPEPLRSVTLVLPERIAPRINN